MEHAQTFQSIGAKTPSGWALKNVQWSFIFSLHFIPLCLKDYRTCFLVQLLFYIFLPEELNHSDAQYQLTGAEALKYSSNNFMQADFTAPKTSWKYLLHIPFFHKCFFVFLTHFWGHSCSAAPFENVILVL